MFGFHRHSGAFGLPVGIFLFGMVVLTGCAATTGTHATQEKRYPVAHKVGQTTYKSKEKACELSSECLLSLDPEEIQDKDITESAKVTKIDDGAKELTTLYTDMSEEKVPEANAQRKELEAFLAQYQPDERLSARMRLEAEPPLPGRKPGSVKKAAQIAKVRVPGRKPETPDFADDKKQLRQAPSDRPVKVLSGDGEVAKSSSVKKFRMGEHDGFTRIVLDLDRKAEARLELDNAAQMLLVDLPGSSWDTHEKWFSTEPPLVMAYLAKPGEDGGTRLVVRLTEEAEIVHRETLKAGDYPYYRIIFDLRGRSVHE